MTAGGTLFVEDCTSLLREEGRLGCAPFTRLRCLPAYGDNLIASLKPDGAARGALQEVLGVAVRVHVNLDTFFVVTCWAMHVVFSCVKVLYIHYIERPAHAQVSFLSKSDVKQLFTYFHSAVRRAPILKQTLSPFFYIASTPA